MLIIAKLLRHSEFGYVTGGVKMRTNHYGENMSKKAIPPYNSVVIGVYERSFYSPS